MRFYPVLVPWLFIKKTQSPPPKWYHMPTNKYNREKAVGPTCNS